MQLIEMFQGAFHQLEEEQEAVIKKAKAALATHIDQTMVSALLMKPCPNYKLRSNYAKFNVTWPLDEAHFLVFEASTGNWSLDHQNGSVHILPEGWVFNDLLKAILLGSNLSHEMLKGKLRM